MEAFEADFAKIHASKHCIAVNSGTSALHATLMALNIGIGDEVLVPVNTFFATAEAVSLTGAVPVFVDCEPYYYNIDTALLAEKLSAKTKAVIGVHLYGQAADLRGLEHFTRQHNLLLIEDCAHAHLATYFQEPVGTAGVASCFSFFPGKNLGAYGEGGAILTQSDELALELRKIREHGAIKKYHHERIGHNYRMEGIQGAILNVKMKYIVEWTEKRRGIAMQYIHLLQGCRQVVVPQTAADNRHVFHLFVIQCEKRDELQAYLEAKGIETGLHYPIPLHLQKAYAFLAYKVGDFPVAEALSSRILSLPMYEQLKKEEVNYVADCIRNFYQAG